MSKKLIAVASAAALALAALVAVPAQASAFAVTWTGNGQAGSTAATAKLVSVPFADTITYENSPTSATPTVTALRAVVTTTSATGGVTVTATGGVKLVSSTAYDAGEEDSTTGVSSLSGTAVGSSYTFYVYSTSSTAGTVTVVNDGNSTTSYIQGVAGPAYKMTATSPSALAPGVKSVISVKVFDAFGNPMKTLAAGNFSVTYLGNAAENATATAYRTATADYAINAQGGTTGGGAAITITVEGAAAVVSAGVTALGDTDLTKFISINNVDLSTQVTALTAQVTALTADYNALAKKYNVLVKKKKRVALK